MENPYLVTVKCDNCDWQMEEQDISQWHDVLCPSCENCIIITDKDVYVMNNMKALVSLGIARQADENTEPEKGEIIVEVDTDNPEVFTILKQNI